MEIIYTDEAKQDMSFWVKSGNQSIIKKIKILLKDIQQNPFSGLGKPKALKYDYQGKWARRIDSKNRIIYEIIEKENIIYVHRLKGHYED